jgi:hypothetical protein
MGYVIDSSGTQNDLSSLNTQLKPIFLDMTIPGNIPAWFAIRQVLQDFGSFLLLVSSFSFFLCSLSSSFPSAGSNYRTRISVYTSYALLIALALIAKLMYHIIVGSVLSSLLLLCLFPMFYLLFL